MRNQHKQPTTTIRLRPVRESRSWLCFTAIGLFFWMSSLTAQFEVQGASASTYSWLGTKQQAAPDQWHGQGNWLFFGGEGPSVPSTGDDVIVSSMNPGGWSSPTNRVFAAGDAPIDVKSLTVGGWESLLDASAGDGSRPGIDSLGMPGPDVKGEMYLWTAYPLTTTDPIRVGYRGGHGRFDHASGLIDINTRIILGSGGFGDSLGQWHQLHEDAEVKTRGFDVGVSGSGFLQQNEGTISCSDTTYQTCGTIVGKGHAIATDPYMPGTGVFHQGGGSFTTDYMRVGDKLGSGGSISVHYTATANYDSLILGNKGTGSFHQTGGTVEVQNDVVMGAQVGAFGEMSFTGGDFTSFGDVRIGIDEFGDDSGGAGRININGFEGSITVAGDYKQSARSSIGVRLLAVSPHVMPIEVGGTVAFDTGSRITIDLEDNFNNLDETGVYDDLANGPTQDQEFFLMVLTGAESFTGVAGLEVVGQINLGKGPSCGLKPAADYWVIEIGASDGLDALIARYHDPNEGTCAQIPPAMPWNYKSDPTILISLLGSLAAILCALSLRTQRRFRADGRPAHPWGLVRAPIVLLVVVVAAGSFLYGSAAEAFDGSIWFQGSADTTEYTRDWMTSGNWIDVNGSGDITSKTRIPDGGNSLDPCAPTSTVDHVYVTSFNIPWSQNGLQSPYPVVQIEENDVIELNTLYIGGWASRPVFDFHHMVGFGKRPNPAAAWGMVQMSGGDLAMGSYIRIGYNGASGRFEQTGGDVRACRSTISVGTHSSVGTNMGVGEWHMSGNSTVEFTGFSIGNNSTGLLHQTGGRVDCDESNDSCITGIGSGWRDGSNNHIYTPGQGMYHMTGGTFDIAETQMDPLEGNIAVGSQFGSAGVARFARSSTSLRVHGLQAGVSGTGTIVQSDGSNVRSANLVVAGKETSGGSYSITGAGTTLWLEEHLFLGQSGGSANFIMIGSGPTITAEGFLHLGSNAMITARLDVANTVSNIHVQTGFFNEGSRIQVILDPFAPNLATGTAIDIVVADDAIHNEHYLELDPATDQLWDLEFVDNKKVRVVYNVQSECNDGIDNDNDGFSDYPDDPECTYATTELETGAVSCGLGYEIGLVLAPLLWLRRARRKRSIR